ncbi:uncharacterized protein LOC119591837 [Penaeus monodon]|uniref:uncharacterized protein LOC119591837 n=1 Tax=Penaeus monodon TaxID=6687 RepID=UPI0018A7AA57|nr:uncharacterized protein LOC119591837 [Penaeus monodon]
MRDTNRALMMCREWGIVGVSFSAAAQNATQQSAPVQQISKLPGAPPESGAKPPSDSKKDSTDDKKSEKDVQPSHVHPPPNVHPYMNVHPYAYGQNPYIHYPYGVHYPVSGVQQPSANFYSDVQHPMDMQDQSTNFQANSPDVQHSLDVQSPSSSVYHPIDVHQYAEQPGNIQQAQDVELEMSIHSFPSSAYRSPSTVQSPLSFAEQRASVHLQTPDVQQTVPIVHQSPSTVQDPVNWSSPNIQSPVHRPINVQSALSKRRSNSDPRRQQTAPVFLTLHDFSETL